MRITFLNPVGTIGGAEQVLLMMIRAALSDGHKVQVLLLDDGPLHAQLQELGVKVSVVTLPNELGTMGDSSIRTASRWYASLKSILRLIGSVPDLWQVKHQLALAISASEPDVIYSNGLKTHLLLALLQTQFRSIKKFWHIHDYYSHRPLVKKLLPVFLDSSTRFVSISRSVADDLRSVVKKGRNSVVYNAVDTERFSPDKKEDCQRKSIGSMGDPIRIGLVATFANWKGHKVFLRALQKVIADGGNVRGVIVGGQIYKTKGSQVSEKELSDFAQELSIQSKIDFIAFQQHPEATYRSLDIVVHASTRPEPFGLTIVEAMACEKPVIASRAGGAAELFDDGVHAVGHPPGDVDALAAAILQLTKDTDFRTLIAKRAREHAVEKFSEPRFRKEWLSAVKSP